ncbi:class I SAM-dependent methyltransferase [Dethiothermospora halolimnae]|uniref:class I SAM-dependent methyltransferase n=1 Tax=Dethiothermospora halolimnae TaxID=3114390 RepID=UPI003CCBC0B5
MKEVYRQTQLYKFLRYCNNNKLENIVLDCGAGGDCPPLGLFKEHGYITFGVDINNGQLKKADKFANERKLDLNIMRGDIRRLPFSDQSMSYIYSYNTIFHMTKKDIKQAIEEIKRILKPGGLSFINFLSIEDQGYGIGEKVGRGEYMQQENGNKVIHTYYEIDEGDKHFHNMKILYKENRNIERWYNNKMIKQNYIDYIVEKIK